MTAARWVGVRCDCTNGQFRRPKWACGCKPTSTAMWTINSRHLDTSGGEYRVQGVIDGGMGTSSYQGARTVVCTWRAEPFLKRSERGQPSAILGWQSRELRNSLPVTWKSPSKAAQVGTHAAADVDHSTRKRCCPRPVPDRFYPLTPLAMQGLARSALYIHADRQCGQLAEVC